MGIPLAVSLRPQAPLSERLWSGRSWEKLEDLDHRLFCLPGQLGCLMLRLAALRAHLGCDLEPYVLGWPTGLTEKLKWTILPTQYLATTHVTLVPHQGRFHSETHWAPYFNEPGVWVFAAVTLRGQRGILFGMKTCLMGSDLHWSSSEARLVVKGPAFTC